MSQCDITDNLETNKKESFLSSYLFEALVINSRNVVNNFDDAQWKFVSYDFGLRITEINKLLFVDVDIETLTLKDAPGDWLKKTLKAIWIILTSVHKSLTNHSFSHLKDILLENCQWTGRTDDLEHCLRYYLQPDNNYVIYTLLYVTAVFENAITNLYFMFGNKDAVLLRDMLRSESIFRLLGSNLVCFIELIIGNSKTLNVRNIIWHGFANVQEIPVYLPAVMFVIMIHIGKLLHHHGIREIHNRRHCHEEVDLDILNHCFPKMQINKQIFWYFIKRNNFIAPSFHPFWDQCYAFYAEKKYGSSMLLLLPQLEHLLRCVFVDVNGLPSRQKMAEHDHLYVTLDEILATHLANGDKNRLYDVLGDPVIVMIYDVFVYPTGPRIKDCISHGHLSLTNFPELLFQHIFNLTICIMTRLIPQFSDPCATYSDCKSLESSQLSAVLISDDEEAKENVNYIIQSMNRCIDRYQSLYHPSALLKSEELTCATNLLKLNDTINQISSVHSIDDNQKLTLNNEVNDLNELDGFIRKTLKINLEDSVLLAILNSILGVNLNTVESVKFDTKLLFVGRRIIQAMNKSCDNLNVSINVKYEQWKSKTMRSRPRKIYVKIVQLLPILLSCFRCLLFIVHFSLLEINFRSIDSSCNEKLFKLLKKIQGNAENITSYTDIASNNWDNIRSHINNLNTTAKQCCNCTIS